MQEAYQITHSDIPLLEYNNIFVANLLWINRKAHRDEATFDLVVRNLPDKWSFYVFDGLERCLDLIRNYKFDNEAIELLKKMNFIDSVETENFYRNFKFSGDLYSLKDGTVFFPGTPIVRITAPLAEANLLTAFFLNAFSYPIRLLSKTVRVKLASKDTMFYAGSLARLPGFEQGLAPQRTAYLLGSPIGSPLFYRKYSAFQPSGKIIANINHALIKSFPSEREAFKHVFRALMDRANFFYVMVDTYNFEQGLQIFIEELRKFPAENFKKVMVCIDSGDIPSRTKYARKQLNESGMQEVRIQAMGDLDEYKIDAMTTDGLPVDCYIAATSLINITDNPVLDAVYKMAELKRADGTIEQKAKLAKGKESYPGRKQVFRKYDDQGFMCDDIIGLEDENLGEPLLQKIIENGQQINSVADIETTQLHLEKQLGALAPQYKQVNERADYKISASKHLNKLLDKVKERHLS